MYLCSGFEGSKSETGIPEHLEITGPTFMLQAELSYNQFF
jgi:hypothetical protein